MKSVLLSEFQNELTDEFSLSFGFVSLTSFVSFPTIYSTGTVLCTSSGTINKFESLSFHNASARSQISTDGSHRPLEFVSFLWDKRLPKMAPRISSIGFLVLAAGLFWLGECLERRTVPAFMPFFGGRLNRWGMWKQVL